MKTKNQKMNAKWTAGDIPDQTGRTAVITGANSGIGYETAKALAENNARVILGCRSMDKGEAALEQIKSDLPGADVSLIPLDLANLTSVKGFTEKIRRDNDRLDILVNNAGVMVPPYGKTTDGFELQMGTNHLGHFALTLRLLPLLISTPGSRVVAVSSLAHRGGNINFNDLHWESRKYKPWRAYGDSKIANLLFMRGLVHRLEESGAAVTVAAAHPGWTATELQRHTGLTSALNPVFAQTTEMGALPSLYAACGPDVENNA
ncbi:MAG: oxidoreductase, partial [Desulfobacterales bacterium]|nr:oxidoreductase [Desulfobacterales bacterium]